MIKSAIAFFLVIASLFFAASAHATTRDPQLREPSRRQKMAMLALIEANVARCAALGKIGAYCSTSDAEDSDAATGSSPQDREAELATRQKYAKVKQDAAFIRTLAGTVNGSNPSATAPAAGATGKAKAAPRTQFAAAPRAKAPGKRSADKPSPAAKPAAKAAPAASASPAAAPASHPLAACDAWPSEIEQRASDATSDTVFVPVGTGADLAALGRTCRARTRGYDTSSAAVYEANRDAHPAAMILFCDKDGKRSFMSRTPQTGKAENDSFKAGCVSTDGTIGVAFQGGQRLKLPKKAAASVPGAVSGRHAALNFVIVPGRFLLRRGGGAWVWEKYAIGWPARRRTLRLWSEPPWSALHLSLSNGTFWSTPPFGGLH
jgi:hypothetical protein